MKEEIYLKKYLEEGVNIGHFDPEILNVDINDIRKGIMPEFPKDPPPEIINGYSAKSKLAPKTVDLPPFIKVTRKDLAQNHKLTDKEIQDFLDNIKRINDYIKKNPAELIYATTRYPKDDPRLAQLNFKMDEMKAASDEYMETHFPENEALFKKIQNKIKDNIEKTDPRRIDTSVPIVSEEDARIARERRLSVLERYKKQVNVKPFFNKKTPEIDWKIDYLNKELAKNGLDEGMRTYSVYQGARIADNETHTDFAAAAFGGRGLGYSGMDGVAINGAKIGDMVASEHGLDPVAHSSILGLKGVAQSPFNPNTGKRSFASTRTGMVSFSPAQPGKNQGTQGAVTGSIIWYWDANANNSNGTQGDWRQLQFFPNSDNTDGYWAVWGSNFLGFSVPRPDLNPSGLNGIINNLQISGKGTIGTPQTTVLTQHRLDNAGFIPIDIKGLSTQGYNYLKGKASNLVRGIGSRLGKYGQRVAEPYRDAKPTQTPKQRRGSAFKKMRGEGNPIGANQFYTGDRIKELNGKEKLTAREESELKDLQQYNEWISSFSDHQPVSDQQKTFDTQAVEEKQSFDNEFQNNSNEIASEIATYVEKTPNLSAEEKKAFTKISDDIKSGKSLPNVISNNLLSSSSSTPQTTPEPPSGGATNIKKGTHEFPDGTTGSQTSYTDQNGDTQRLYYNDKGESVDASGRTAKEAANLADKGKDGNNAAVGIGVVTGSVAKHTPSKEEISQYIANITPDMIASGEIQVNSERVPYTDGNFKITYDSNGKRIFTSNRDADGNQGANFPDNSFDSDNSSSMTNYGKPIQQVVYPTDGSEPYLLFEKYSYHNKQSQDNSEIPDPWSQFGSDAAHLLGKVFPLVNEFLFRGAFGAGNKVPDHVKKMGIHGMAHTEQKIPLSELSEDFRKSLEQTDEYNEWNDANTSRQTASKFPPPGQEAEHTYEDGSKVKYYNRGIRTRPDGTKYMEVLILPWIEPKAGVHDGYFGSLHHPGSYTTKVEMNHLPDAKPYEAEGDLMPSNPDFRGAGNNKKFTPPKPKPKNVRGSGARGGRGGKTNESYISESVKLGHFDPEALTVDLEKLRKGILPEYPKDPPPKLVNGYSEKSKLLPQKVEGEPFIKVDKKELAKNHKLKDSEIKEFMDEINMINEYIKQNPAELVHAMQRYPKHDVRLAQLNWQMDQKLQASEEYMETHFPENERLFNKLQTKIKQNIDLTDPKNFKGHKEAPKFVQNDITEQQRRKEIIARHFKKKGKKENKFFS